jgi:mono/diheme cytochrome c family protein
VKNKLVRNIIVALLGIGIALQLVPYGRAHSNPAVQANPNWDTPRTRELFYRACADCHSNETVWPWYSNVAPMSWLVQKDVDEGREKFNISEYGLRKDESEEAAEEVEKGAMPMAVYLPLHPSANLSAAEKQELINGLKATFGGK